MVLQLALSLFSALAIFLFGMQMMSEGLENLAQDKMKSFFSKTIRNPLMGAVVGALATMLVQSSSATTVMVIGFVNAGLMSLYQSVGVIIGANIGTTITGQIVSFNINQAVPYLIIAGGILYMFMKKPKARHAGMIFLGFGLLFMGMGSMSSAMRPLASMDWFSNAILMLEGNMFLGILAGLALTVMVQSSSAFTAVVIGLALADSITLNAAVPMLFGSNMGTCITALISSITANKTAKKAALIHLLFNLLGTVIFLPLITPFYSVIRSLGGEVHSQIANAHTIFNVVSALVLLPFSKFFVFVANKIVKDDTVEAEEIHRLDSRFLDTPAIAFDQAFNESLSMYQLARKNMEIASAALLEGTVKDLDILYANETLLNALEVEISQFLASIHSKHKSSEIDTNRITSMIRIISDIERIGDHAKNLAELAQEAYDSNIFFTSDAKMELTKIFDQTLNALNASYESYRNNSPQKAEDTLEFEEQIDMLEQILRERHITRLKNNACQATSGVLFMDAITNFERIGDHSVNIAQSVLKA